MDVISRDDRRPRRPTGPRSGGWPTCSCTARRGSSTCRRRGWRPPWSWPATSPTWCRAPTDPPRRPHLGTARRRDRRRPAQRRRDHLVPLPHGGGRQRDDHQAARQRLVLGLAVPRREGQGLSTTPARVPDWVEETLRFDTSSQMLLRVTTGDGRAARHGAIAEGERVLLLVGSANRDPEVFDRTPTATTSTATPPSSSASAAAATSAWALPWPGWRRAWCSRSSSAGCRDYDDRRAGAERVHSINVRGFATPPHHGQARCAEAASRCPVPDRPSRAPAGGDRRVVGDRRGHRRGAGRRRPPGGARRAPGREVRGDGRSRSGPRAARRTRSGSTWPRRTSVEAFADAAAEARRRDRHHGVERRARPQPGTALRHPPTDLRRTVEVNLAGRPPARRRAGSRAWCERHHGDIVFVTLRHRATPRARRWPPTWRRSGGSRDTSGPCRWSSRAPACGPPIVQPGQTLTEMGTDWDPDTTTEVLGEWVRLGAGPPQPLPAPRGRGRGRAARRSTPPRDASPTDRGPARGTRSQRRSDRSQEAHHDRRRRTARAAAGLGRRGRARAPRGAARRPHRPHATGCAPSAATSGQFRLADRDVVLLTGAEANELFFRAPEEVLDQAEAYPFMTPIFGEGVVFDAPPERRREMLHNQALRDKFMRGHAATIADEVERHGGRAGPTRGRSTSSTGSPSSPSTPPRRASSARKFRRELDRRFAELYHDLEQGTDAIAYVDPYAPIESFRRRDEARLGLVALVQGIMDRRARRRPPPTRTATCSTCCMSIRDEDGTPRFSADMVTGHVHLDDVRRPPHHLGHRGVDAHRAAAPSRRARRGASTSSTSSTPTARR